MVNKCCKYMKSLKTSEYTTSLEICKESISTTFYENTIKNLTIKIGKHKTTPCNYNLYDNGKIYTQYSDLCAFTGFLVPRIKQNLHFV